MSSDLRPAKWDIAMWRNDYWVQVYSLTLDSNPIDLQNATVNIQIRKGCGGTLALSLTNGNGVTITGANNNQVSISKLVDIEKGMYRWDMQITYASGVVKTYIEGDFEVQDDVTKP